MTKEPLETKFTPADIKLMVALVSHLEGPINVNWEAGAKEAGYANAASFGRSWRRLKAKISTQAEGDATNSAAGGATTGHDDETNTKNGVSGGADVNKRKRGRPTTHKVSGGDDDDEHTDGSKAKKLKANNARGSGRGIGNVKSEEAEEDVKEKKVKSEQKEEDKTFEKYFGVKRSQGFFGNGHDGNAEEGGV